MRHGFTLVFALALAACAGRGGAGSGPEPVLRAYVEAVRSGDADAAYALLDDETRAAVTLPDFRRLMTENQAELAEQVDELSRRAERGIEATAAVPLDDGESAALVLENGRYRLDGDVVGSATLRTPRDAVLALRRALRRRSLSGVARVLARQPRAELEAEIERVLQETADELDLQYEVRGNVAHVRTTGGREIHLVREAGEWRVVEVR